MAFDEDMALRVRWILANQPRLAEIKMFGGLCFMVDGNMCCAVRKDDLMVRVGHAGREEALDQRGTRPMDITGRRMQGFVLVDNEVTRADKTLDQWVQRGLAFATSLPAK